MTIKLEQRELFHHLANKSHVKFSIVDFQASWETLCNRIAQRQHDPSETTITVLQ
ncbi:AAA family ATPase [Methyloglobulus morosus]|uniref:AAA family ATPase n=1 Tax=Methyloglobulus morosus TaxID=1410681 RepID=UPI00041F6F29|nr:AAA family ATPase [Methyloglobulus morosus]